MILHLGVIDIPYSDEDISTGDVAEILESQYHVMQTFYDFHQTEISEYMADSVAGALENIMSGAPAGQNPFGTAENNIQERFVDFLNMQEMDGLKGIPTKASLEGVSHRKKSKKNGAPRPSFVDTHQYRDSMVAWIDE